MTAAALGAGSALDPPPPTLLIADGGATVTVVAGTTFCLSNRTGDVVPGAPLGLFFRDARVLSRWELRLDGVAPDPLSVLAPESFGARFVLRRPPLPGLADSTLLVVRERLVDDGLHESITLTNLGREPTAVTVALYVDADFADLFAVKEGRVAAAVAHAGVYDGELLLTHRGVGSRGVRVRATGGPLLAPGSLIWRVMLAPRATWRTDLVALPIAATRQSALGGAGGAAGSRVSAAPVQRGESVGGAAGRRLSDFRRDSARIEAGDPALNHALRRSEDDLAALRIQTGGGHAFIAAGAPWFMTLFGRDSLLTGWMALPLEVGLAVGTLETLARVQGRRVDPLTEEEPGRILHELRLGPDSEDPLGGSHNYGTIDATPLFVMLVAECLRWGADPARIRALLPAVDAALDWIEGYGDRDGDGFVEYRRATDRGLANQGWKDSFDAISDRDGRLAEPPIALCEVQGYVYGAYQARAYLAEILDGDHGAAARWRTRAADLRAAFHERFWLSEHGWYALGLDGAKRPIDALTSNGAHTLWTGIATDECATQLVTRLAQSTMDTGYGLRTLAEDMGGYNPMSYHNGSVWPHDTAIAVAGLLAYPHIPGAVELAHRLASGLIDAAVAFGGRLPELFCGFPRSQFSPPVPYPTSCSPQAWAAAAPLLLVRAFLGLAPDVPAQRLALAPRLPSRWGRLDISQLRLGTETADIAAHADDASVTGLPASWTVRQARTAPGGSPPAPGPPMPGAIPAPRDG